MYTKNFDPEKGELILPDIYSEVVSSDAVFELVTCFEANKIILERKDDVIGHRIIMYIIDKADKTREPTRKFTVDFFKNTLGFKDKNIIFVDRSEFVGTSYDNLSTNFSAETKEAIKKFARTVFEDTQYPLANQILNIAICECQGGNYAASNYFVMASNFELTILLKDNFTLANSREYFDNLKQKIISENLTQIIFKESNSFFVTDPQRGVEPH